MFNWLKGTPAPEPASVTMRDTLFGDQPVALWPKENAPTAQGHSWDCFLQARRALSENNTPEAIRQWQNVLALPNQETRHYLQAWHFLRAYGIQPPPHLAKQIYGVVIEVMYGKQYAILAAYPDYAVRYYSPGTAGVIWEHPNNSLDALVNALLAQAQKTVMLIGPWDKARPPIPPPSQVRLNMLTPSGLHFGQGHEYRIMQDPSAATLFQCGVALMQAVNTISRNSDVQRKRN